MIPVSRPSALDLSVQRQRRRALYGAYVAAFARDTRVVVLAIDDASDGQPVTLRSPQWVLPLREYLDRNDIGTVVTASSRTMVLPLYPSLMIEFVSMIARCVSRGLDVVEKGG